MTFHKRSIRGAGIPGMGSAGFALVARARLSDARSGGVRCDRAREGASGPVSTHSAAADPLRGGRTSGGSDSAEARHLENCPLSSDQN